MDASIIFSAVWVIAATVLAFLPMRWQIVPGLCLLGVAPVLLVWLWRTEHPYVALFGGIALVSMFRRPLAHLLRRAAIQRRRE